MESLDKMRDRLITAVLLTSMGLATTVPTGLILPRSAIAQEASQPETVRRFNREEELEGIASKVMLSYPHSPQPGDRGIYEIILSRDVNPSYSGIDSEDLDIYFMRGNVAIAFPNTIEAGEHELLFGPDIEHLEQSRVEPTSVLFKEALEEYAMKQPHAQAIRTAFDIALVLGDSGQLKPHAREFYDPNYTPKVITWDGQVLSNCANTAVLRIPVRFGRDYRGEKPHFFVLYEEVANFTGDRTRDNLRFKIKMYMSSKELRREEFSLPDSITAYDDTLPNTDDVDDFLGPANGEEIIYVVPENEQESEEDRSDLATTVDRFWNKVVQDNGESANPTTIVISPELQKYFWSEKPQYKHFLNNMGDAFPVIEPRESQYGVLLFFEFPPVAFTQEAAVDLGAATPIYYLSGSYDPSENNIFGFTSTEQFLLINACAINTNTRLYRAVQRNVPDARIPIVVDTETAENTIGARQYVTQVSSPTFILRAEDSEEFNEKIKQSGRNRYTDEYIEGRIDGLGSFDGYALVSVNVSKASTDKTGQTRNSIDTLKQLWVRHDNSWYVMK
jgi:hypothetical protein